jgi:hypothetical protein
MKIASSFQNLKKELQEIPRADIFGLISIVLTIIGIGLSFSKLFDTFQIILFFLGIICVIIVYAYLFRLSHLLKSKFKDVNSNNTRINDTLKDLLHSRFDTLDSNFEHYQDRLAALDHIIEDYFGYAWRENKYFNRSHDFAGEKKTLAFSLVRNLLPDIIERIENEHSQSEKNIRIILDSGTTITPVFPCLVRIGIPYSQDSQIDFYTNNLAGIDEIHRIPANEDSKFSERNFNLIGGRPLNQYRATTGMFTQDILADLFEEQKNSNGKIISIGIITANWFLAGSSMDRLCICGKGEGHLEFKQSLVDNCHYLVIMTPLGKLLPIDDIRYFNRTLGKDYQVFEISDKKRNQTYLHTTFRDSHSSQSPLRRISESLNFVRKKQNNKNFIFSRHCSFLEALDNINVAQAIRMDVPHDYIRNQFEQIYGYRLPSAN